MVVLRMNRAEYQSARRKPRVLPSCLSVIDNIPDSADGVDQLLLVVPVDLVPQAANQDVHDVGLRVEMVVPDVLQDHGLRNHSAGVAHEIFEQAEFARLELDGLPGSNGFARDEV